MFCGLESARFFASPGRVGHLNPFQIYSTFVLSFGRAFSLFLKNSWFCLFILQVPSKRARLINNGFRLDDLYLDKERVVFAGC